MRRRSAISVITLLFVPATTFAQQSLTFSFGGFVPRSEEARFRNDDVLANNLDFLAFNIKDFSSGTVNLEYTAPLGDFFEAGLGVGIYRSTVPSVYADFVNDNGSEIEQDLKLRIVPFTATIRFLPLGHGRGIEPFLGAGLGIFNWRYTETGEFIFSDGVIDRDSFVGSGTSTGPVILGGLRIPLGAWGLGTEIRYQRAEGDLPVEEEFAGSRIDLGGWTYLATLHVRF